MKYKDLYKIPKICNNTFGLKLSIESKVPTKLLFSPSIGLFWYYKDDVPKILDDDYDFSDLIEYVDFSIATSLAMEDPEIVNWNLISYSLEHLNSFFSTDELPIINLYYISIGDRVRFANGECGTVKQLNPLSHRKSISVKLDNVRVCPNSNTEGVVYQNSKDGKHSNCEETKPQWSIISWVPCKDSLK